MSYPWKEIGIAFAGALGANIAWDGAKKLVAKPKKKRYDDDDDEDEDEGEDEE